MLVDSHCHLNYLDEPDLRLTEARAAGIGAFLCIGVDQAGIGDVLALANRHADVWASVGVHPDSAADEPTLDWLSGALGDPNVVAIGETGLDFFRLAHAAGADAAGAEDASDVQMRQRRAFDYQLALADEQDLPVIIHTRAAESQTRDVLRAHPGVTGVLHCFTESWTLAREALDLGYYISISGIVTFKNAENVREVARQVPADRLLVETDAPWLAPVPHRGQPNHPALVTHTAAFLAELRGVDPEVLARTTTDNFYSLFSRASR